MFQFHQSAVAPTQSMKTPSEFQQEFLRGQAQAVLSRYYIYEYIARDNQPFSYPQVKNVPSSGTDLFPPQRVTDLRASVSIPNQAVVLTFTSPGDDYSDGTGKLQPYLHNLSHVVLTFKCTFTIF